MGSPTLSNQAARRLFLHRHGLGPTATAERGKHAVHDIIHQLGFVQIDSINTVARAHHMILHSRCPGYRPEQLATLLEKDRALFEHWTHDASIVPTDFYPHWRLRFQNNRARLLEQWSKGRRAGFEKQIDPLLAQIRNGGPVCSSDVGANEQKSSGGWWDWHPSKTALEFLWHTGELMVTRREGFRKFYDLSERVIPQAALGANHAPQETVSWACNQAIDRLGFATPREIAAFWDTVPTKTAHQWCKTALSRGEVIEIGVVGSDGQISPSLARPDVLEVARHLPGLPEKIRILSPFDPALRDRKRAERLFGFDYRIEVFVPAPKRKYGYYVFPVLEGNRLIGRIDMKADRKADLLRVTAFWPEAGVRPGKGRLARLESAIHRTRRLAQVGTLVFEADWLRS